MIEQMQAWIRLFGPEHFAGELDYLLGIRAHLRPTDAARVTWRVAQNTSDATFIQGSTVQHWDRQQRQLQPQQAQQLPDLAQPFVVLEPTLSSVPASLRCDPRSRDALLAMWETLDAELTPVRLRFSIGLRCFELLRRIQNRFTSQAQYQLDQPVGTLASLQPASGQLHLSPQAQPASALQAVWRRRAAPAAANEWFEQLPLPLALSVYCQRTTRRLFSSRLRTARISLRAQTVIRLTDHSDQTLAILIQLQLGQQQFIDIAQQLDWDERSLGNALLGLYLCGMVELELDTSISTLFATELREQP